MRRHTALIAAAAAILLAAPAMGVEKRPDSYLRYLPSLGGNLTYAIIYTLMSAAFWWHVFVTGPKVDKWALVLPIGTSFSALGFILRIVMRWEQRNMPLYIVMYMSVVLSPAAFLAFNYILFGRLIAALEGHKPNDVRQKSRYSFIPPRWVKRIFVVSDVCTFLVQAAGGGQQATGDPPTVATGDTTFLAGVTAQGVSYLLFTALTIYANIMLLRDDKKRYAPWNMREPSVLLLNIVHISSIGILWRSVFRIIEMAQGYRGELYSNEIYLFVLDALPLVIAMGVYVPLWPGVLLRRIRVEAAARLGEDVDGERGAETSAQHDEKIAASSPPSSRDHSVGPSPDLEK